MLAHQSPNRPAFPDLLIGFVALALSATLAGPSYSAEISGEPRIVDGDTVEIGHIKIRFAGIDAPETDQICLDSKGDRWACGVTARDGLIKCSGGRSWDCELIGTDKYGRSLGKCFIEGEDVSAWIVHSGWALSFVRYSHDYDREEGAARDSKAGLWAGAFIAPWEWRHRDVSTTVLGALSVPIDAQKILLGAVSSAGAPSPDCTIKASAGRGECIYHLPGDRWYGKMSMDSGKNRWFCTAEEAESAGCRAPKR
jgi:endonuclease YncB( thermonuclease family)